MTGISVVIPTTKKKNEIKGIDKLSASDYSDYEVIIRSDIGISKARNEGIKEANFDKLLFIDDDAIPCGDFLREAEKTLAEHAAVAGRVIHTGPEVIGEIVSNYDQGGESRYTDTIVGCNMGFRRRVFKDVGYFDENIQWGHDETEFKDRLLEEYDIYYNSDLVVKHPYATSISDFWRKRYRLGLADPYYWQKSGYPVKRTFLNSFFSPYGFLSDSFSSTIVKSVGRIFRNMGQIRAILRS